jgi:hypothetical protein
LFEKKLIKEKEFEKYLKIIKKDQIKKNLWNWVKFIKRSY